MRTQCDQLPRDPAAVTSPPQCAVHFNCVATGNPSSLQLLLSLLITTVIREATRIKCNRFYAKVPEKDNPRHRFKGKIDRRPWIKQKHGNLKITLKLNKSHINSNTGHTCSLLM